MSNHQDAIAAAGAGHGKIFTVEQANASLPLVGAIARDIATLSISIVERRERLQHLQGDRPRRADDIYAAELAQTERDVERDVAQLQEYVDELKALGVDLKNAQQGLIDFPAEIDGRPVYLCWKLGEPEVLYWHEIEAGFAGRQSLTADTAPGSDLPGSHA